MRSALIAGGLIGLMTCLILFAALPSSAVAVSFAQTTASTPTAPEDLTPTIVWVSTFEIGPTPTPALAEESEAEGSCVPPSQSEVDLPEEIWGPTDDMTERLLTYFNAGGSLEGIEETLRNQVFAFYEFRMSYLWQLVEQDVTGDSVPEIFVAITLPITPTYGNAYLFMFTCESDHYEARILWAHGGAGSAGEGLYDGGGTRVISVQDLNNNGYREVLFRIGWLWRLTDRDIDFAEYYLLEWREDEWVSLHEEINELGEIQFYIPGETIGGLEIVDQDDDGVFEIVIDGQPYRWDGEMYVLSGDSSD